MAKKGDKRENVASDEPKWIRLPTTGEVQLHLDDEGAAKPTEVDLGFGSTPYCVQLGLRVGKDRSTRYGTLDLPAEGDRFYAEVRSDGRFEIYLKAQHLHDQRVTVVWWRLPTTGPSPSGPR